MMLFFKRIWIQLTNDKRQFGALCVVLAVGLLLWARLIVAANMTKQAVADPEGSYEATDVIKPHKTRSQPKRVELDSDPKRDPFLISTFHFPKPTSVTELPGDTGKVVVEPAEEHEQASARKRSQIQALAERYVLEAVMSGNPRMAVISGETYRLGEMIPAVENGLVLFKLVEVRPRSVVLEYETFRFELRIATPGG